MTIWAGTMLLVPLAVACAKTTPTALTPDGARVRITAGDRAHDCEYLGDFVSVPGARGFPGGVWASNQVRNLAAEYGATDVVFDDKATVNVVGKGYRCP